MPSATFMPGAQNTVIYGGNFTVVSGDVVNNHNYGNTSSLQATDSLQSIIAWLAAPNVRGIQSSNLSKRTKGTGEWFVGKDLKFQTWKRLEDRDSFLWGIGMPGAGKTMLASLVIDHVGRCAEQSNGQIGMAYIVIRYTEPMSISDILAALVRQLLESHPETLLPLVRPIYTRHLLYQTNVSQDGLLELLLTFSRSFKACFFILDGLDEAATGIQGILLRLLRSLPTKLFITSRPLEALQSMYPNAVVFDVVATKEDISLHISEKIGDLADLKVLLDQNSLKEEIVTSIQKNSDGMFLHASLQVDAIQNCLSIRDIRRTLEDMPSGIDEIYAATIKRIEEQPKPKADLAKHILLWIRYASTLPTMEQLRHRLAVDPSTHRFDPDLLLPEATLISMCFGLIKDDKKLDAIFLIHYTTWDAITPYVNKWFPNPQSAIVEELIACFEAYDLHDPSPPITTYDDFLSRTNQSPFLHYAHVNWSSHANILDPANLPQALIDFVLRCRRFPIPVPFIDDYDQGGPLHVAAFYGLPLAIFQGDLTRWDVNARTPIANWTPLILAAYMNEPKIVEALLQVPTIDVNATESSGMSALLMACRDGSTEVASLLVAHPEVDVNQPEQGDDYGTPLLYASFHGHEAIVEMLLSSGKPVDVNRSSTDGETPLSLAAVQGHEGVLRLLLATPDIEVNSVSGRGQTPLVRATLCQRETAVGLLATFPSTDVNIPDQNGATALSHAAHLGYSGIVKHLLAAPVIKLDVRDGNTRTPLMSAAATGHQGIVEAFAAFPKVGEVVNLVDKSGMTAVMLAVLQSFA